MSIPQHHLAQSDRHIGKAEARIARQRELATELRRDGHDAAATQAEAVLDTMAQSLECMRHHRAIIAAEVDQEQRDQL
jgi:hypothetical protein